MVVEKHDRHVLRHGVGCSARRLPKGKDARASKIYTEAKQGDRTPLAGGIFLCLLSGEYVDH